MIADAELLRRYAEEGSEGAFAELVNRHLNLVYSAALRRTNGDAHRAADVSQIVFTSLAREAASLTRHPLLAGWLYTATRHAAHNAMREERRRRAREQEISAMQETTTEAPAEADWTRLRPVLDRAMDELSERDRNAVLARFFEGQAFAEIGAALKISEDAARMRVERALEKLRARLARRGVASTGAALGVLLTSEAAGAPPLGLAASVTGAALVGASAGVTSSAVTVLAFMNSSKIAAGTVVAMLALTVGTVGWQMRARQTAEVAVAAAQQENEALAAKLRAVQERVAIAQKSGAASPAALGPGASSGSPSGGGAAGSPNRMAGEELMQRHSEVRRAIADYWRSMRAGAYSPLFKALRLSPAQVERFLDLSMQGLSGRMATHSGPIPFAFEGDRAEAQRELRVLLGEEGYAQYQNFDEGMGRVHQTTTELAGALYRTTTPLTVEQAEQVRHALMENRAPTSWSTRSQYDWPAIMTAAERILSSPQLAELDHLRAQDEFQQATTQSRVTAAAAIK